MNGICFIVDKDHEDKSVPKLIEAIQKLGLDCDQSESPRTGYLNVGWGRSAGAEGLNQERPHNKLWEIRRLHEKKAQAIPFAETFEGAVRMAWSQMKRGKESAILGRNLSHRRGADIQRMPMSEATLEEQLALAYTGPHRDFWTLEVDRDAEYRVHVFMGQVEKVATKVPKNEEAKASRIWNQDNCDFNYSLPFPDGVRAAAVPAVAAYGLNFAAVDVLRSVDGDFFILEVNLRPGLNDDMVSYYATKFVEVAKAR